MNDYYLIGLIISNAVTFAFAVRGWYLASRLEKNIQEAGIVREEIICGYGHCETARKVLPVRAITHNRDDCMHLLLDELGYEFSPKKTVEQEPELKKKEDDG